MMRRLVTRDRQKIERSSRNHDRPTERQYVNDLDVSVTVMLFEDSPAVLSLGLLCEEMGSPTNVTERVSISG